ncbi:B-4DMT family transporter [Kutzneria chonburiensis]|uniref:B-4DMT family transporter n=1 Tax=Kutzneria chonburiensis TaxID=1483604 RepID=A0ABV6MM56_9PSEU|nr:B-4DMT family transporter [Kutzneria chonburiensis]
MKVWLVRGLVLAVVHAAVQTAQAWVRAGDPTAVGWLRPTALSVLVAVAVVWGGIDGWRGLEGRGLAWFKASLVAGPVGGVLGVIGQGVFVDDTGAEALPVAITGGAAFIALLVLVPAAVGLLFGKMARPAAPTNA